MLESLAEGRLQDDRRFVEAYVESRAARGYGPVRIAAELRQRGIADEAVREALGRCATDWPAAAEAAARKKFGERAPRDPAEVARRMRFLEYRGFTREQMRAALRTAEARANEG